MATGGFDWSLCIFCQTLNSETVQCPALQSHLRTDVGRGYTTVTLNINGFRALGITTPVANFIQAESLEEALISHEAKWHKSCQLQLAKTSWREHREEPA